MFWAFVYEYSTLIGIAIIIIMCLLNKYIYGYEFMKVTDDLCAVESVTNYCDNKECVRCSTYKDMLSTAMLRLGQINDAEMYRKLELGMSRVTYSLSDRQQPNIFFYRELESVPVWDKELFEECDMLENTFTVIQEEFDSLVSQKNRGVWKRNSTQQGSWDVCHLIDQGKKVTENCALCPRTLDIVLSMNSSMKNNVFGNVMFSIVKANTVITEHYGSTNIRLRCHLGLYVTEDCKLCVENESLSWTEGKCLVFDDSFLHSVTHFGETDDIKIDEGHSGKEYETFDRKQDRAVLIIDLWHPGVTLDEREAIDFLFSAEPV